MNIQPIQVLALTFQMSETDARDFLVDARPTQDAVRAVLAQQAAGKALSGNGWHKNGLNLAGVDSPLPAGSIARAAKKQNKRFFGQPSKKAAKAKADAPKVECLQCGKMVKDSPMGWKLHNARAHPQFDEPSASAEDELQD